MKSFKLLVEAFESLDIEYTEETIEKFKIYMELVLSWNHKVNLTAITDHEEFIIKHFINSLMCCKLKEMGSNIIDIGTGAGFPGIPMALIFPKKKFVLVDSLNKRIKFLNEVISELNLKNVTPIHSRAEDIGMDEHHREKYDLSVSRAVARLSLLVEYCLPLVKTGGYFASYKSNDIDNEINESKKAIQLLGGKLVEREYLSMDQFNISHQVLYIQKIKNTPTKYPRKPGIASKDPIC